MLSRTTLLALLAPLPLAAEVTPETLLEAWSDGAPPEMSAAEVTREGETVALRDVVVTLAPGVTLSTSRATLAPEGEATWIRPADELTLSVEGEGSAPLTARLSSPDATIRAEGDPGAIAYRLAARSMTLTGEGPAESPTTAEIVFETLEAGYEPADNGPLRIDVAADRARIRTETPATDADPAGRTDTIFDDMTLGIVAAPDALSDASSAATIAAAGPIETRLTAGSLSQTYTATEADGQETVTIVRTGETETRYRLGDGRLLYDGDSSGIVAEVQLPGSPLTDAAGGADRLAISLDLPVVAPEAPAPFDMSLSLSGVTVSDQVWDLVDPGQALPRDPGSLSLLAEGLAIVRPSRIPTADFRQGATVSASGPAAVEPRRLEITDLTATGLGARVSGTGAVSFGPADGGPIGPADGAIQVEGQGIVALLDTLSEIGAIDPGQALGARMVLGMFAEAGPEAGSLVSEITFTPDGAIRVNGMQIATLPN